MTLFSIGYVRNDVAKPQPRGWDKVESGIEILPQHEAKLLHLDRYSHVIVTFYMDLAPGAPEHRRGHLRAGRERSRRFAHGWRRVPE
jgi:tRNA (Thr-GGU) A37 N-methylase